MSQIKKGALISYITVGFNIISGFFFTPFLISKVGNSAYGLYTLVSTFLNYFLIDFGLGNSVAKYLSEYIAKDDMKKANEFITVIVKLFSLLAVIIGVIFLIIYFFLEDIFKGLTVEEMVILRKMYVVGGISSVFAFVFVPLNGILTSYELFVDLKIIELFRKVFIILVSIFALSFYSNVVVIVVINAIASVMVVLYKLIQIKRKTNIALVPGYFDYTVVKNTANFSIWITVILLAQRFIIPIAPTILGVFSNSAEISIFSIATTIEGYVYTISACLSGLFLPHLTKLFLEHNVAEIDSIFINVGRIQTYIIGLIISIFVVYGKEFLVYWIGFDYIKSYYVVLLIMPSAIVVYSQEVANQMLMIEDKIRYKAICYSFGAVVSMIISCILAPHLGAIGAGIGIAVCLWGFQVLGMNLIYPKILDLDIKNFFKQCYSKTLPIMFLVSLLGLFIKKYWIIDSLYDLVLQMFFTFMFLCLLLYFLSLKKDERKVINHFLKLN